VFHVSFLNDLADIVPDKTSLVVVYGASSQSQDAPMALDKLERAGYTNIAYLEGGLEAWCAAGYDLEGDAIEQQDDPQTMLMLPEGRYMIDADASRIEWAGRNPSTTHMGSVDISTGAIDIANGSITGSVDIDMTTIHNINLEGDEMHPVLEAHLHSDDFFFTKPFPKAVFSVKRAERIDPGWLTSPNYHVAGELNLRGVSADLEFDATIAHTENDSLIMEAHFDMDRTKWNVIYGSTRFFEYLGMHKVFELISLQLRVIAVPD
jgi:polyisoprenoid-binding protein YceI